jgi:hypothetical protein
MYVCVCVCPVTQGVQDPDHVVVTAVVAALPAWRWGGGRRLWLGGEVGAALKEEEVVVMLEEEQEMMTNGQHW